MPANQPMTPEQLEWLEQQRALLNRNTQRKQPDPNP
jgi:hypothetical protein